MRIRWVDGSIKLCKENSFHHNFCDKWTTWIWELCVHLFNETLTLGQICELLRNRISSLDNNHWLRSSSVWRFLLEYYERVYLPFTKSKELIDQALRRSNPISITHLYGTCSYNAIMNQALVVNPTLLVPGFNWKICRGYFEPFWSVLVCTESNYLNSFRN